MRPPSTELAQLGVGPVTSRIRAGVSPDRGAHRVRLRLAHDRSPGGGPQTEVFNPHPKTADHRRGLSRRLPAGPARADLPLLNNPPIDRIWQGIVKFRADRVVDIDINNTGVLR